MPTTIKGNIFSPMIDITDESCDGAVISPSFNVSPSSIMSGDSLTTIYGDCLGLNKSFFYSTTDLPIPIADESQLTALSVSDTFTNTTGSDITIYAYMKCQDGTNTTWFKDSFIVVDSNTVLIPPVVQAGSQITKTLPVSSTLLSATASDPDGTIANIQWVQVSGANTASITNSNTLTPFVENLIEGTYVFQITVTDNDGLTASDTIQVVIQEQEVFIISVVKSNPCASSGDSYATFTISGEPNRTYTGNLRIINQNQSAHGLDITTSNYTGVIFNTTTVVNPDYTLDANGVGNFTIQICPRPNLAAVPDVYEVELEIAGKYIYFQLQQDFN